MKTLILSFVLLVVVGCSNNNNPLKYSAENLSVPSGEESYAFGLIEKGSPVADKTLSYLRSSGSSEAAGSNVSLSNSIDFAIVSASGCNRSLSKSTDTCYVKVRFLKNKVVGQYSTTLSVGDGVNNKNTLITAEVIASSIPDSLVVYEQGVSVSSLDFGPLNKNSTLTKTLQISNEGSQSVEDLTVIVSGDKFKLTSNSCPSVLRVGLSCYLKVAFLSGSGSSSDEIASGSLVLKQNPLALSGVVRGTPVITGSPDIRFYENSIEISSLNLGSVSSGSVITKVITVKNVGTATHTGSFSLAADASFKITSNGCGSYLAASKSCYIRLSFSSTMAGEKNAALVSGALSLPLSATIGSSGPNFAIRQGIIDTSFGFMGYLESSAMDYQEGYAAGAGGIVWIGGVENNQYITLKKYLPGQSYQGSRTILVSELKSELILATPIVTAEKNIYVSTELVYEHGDHVYMILRVQAQDNEYTENSGGLVIFRYNLSDFSRDFSFNGNGLRVLMDPQTIYGPLFTKISGGKVYAGGYRGFGYNSETGFDYDALLLRLNLDGSPDSSFANNGFLIFDTIEHEPEIEDVIVHDNNVYAVVSTSEEETGFQYARVYRYSNSGVLLNTLNIDAMDGRDPRSIGIDHLNRLYVQSPRNGDGNSSMMLVRLVLANGVPQIDNSFGSAGVIQITPAQLGFNEPDTYMGSDDIFIDQGKIVATVNISAPSQENFLILELNLDGSLSTTFNGGLSYVGVSGSLYDNRSPIRYPDGSLIFRSGFSLVKIK